MQSRQQILRHYLGVVVHTPSPEQKLGLITAQTMEGYLVGKKCYRQVCYVPDISSAIFVCLNTVFYIASLDYMKKLMSNMNSVVSNSLIET